MPADKFNLLASSRGRWFKRVGMTLTAGAILTGFYSIYAMVLRPVVETPGLSYQHVSVEIPPPPPPRQGVEMAERYLASQPWAAKAKWVIRTEEAFVYFEDWDPLEDDEAARCTPFAMIYTTKGRNPDEKPITIISDSAYVRFAKKFSFTSPDPGRVIGGALEGNVQIHGDNNLQIMGRNFVFNEEAMRIWCDNHVDFAYGPHKGNGHGLQIELIPDPVARAQEKLAVKGFKTIRLRRNVSMDLEFRDGQSKVVPAEDAKLPEDPQPPPFAETASNEAKPKKPTIVKVRSAGSFEFVVATNVATFEDEVRVYQPTEPGKYNSLQSDLMTLYFEPKKKIPDPQAPHAGESQTAQKTEPPPEDKDRFQSVDSNLTFKRLVAVGENVILRSETNDLIATMHRLDYDAQTRAAKLTSRGTVRVLQKQSEMHSPCIDLLHQQGGRVTHMTAQGPGWLKSLDKNTGKLAFAARWKKLLKKFPDPATGEDIIKLESEAQVLQPEDGIGLAAEVIKLWLRPQEPSAASASVPKPQNSADDRDDRANRMQPKKLLAETNVAIASPNMLGETQRLEVWFEPAAPAVNLPAETAEARRSRENLKPAIKQIPKVQNPSSPPGTPNVLAVSQEHSRDNLPLAPPASEKSLSSSDSTVNQESKRPDLKTHKSNDGPIKVVSDLIQVNVLTYGGQKKSEISEVKTFGNVDVVQQHGPEEQPLHMTGEQLHVKNRAKNDQVMTLWGSPAHVRDRGTHIEGRQIFLDRRQNFSKVTGAGLLQLPVKRSLDGEELAEAKPLDIWWEEQMTFDGLDAKFFGNVRAVLNNGGSRSNMRCEEMQVVMSRRVSFMQDQSSQQKGQDKIEIERVYCKDGVEFDSYKYEEAKLSEVRRGRFAELTVNQTTGHTSGQGPGWIKLWRRGRGKRAGMTPNASVKANRALKPDATDWEYMRIDFDGTSDGNLKQKFNTFKDNVQIVYGPVERPLMVIPLENPEKLPKDAGWMRCQSLRITQHEPAQKDEASYAHLLAKGNVYLEGRTAHGTFNGSANSVSFDESKGLYTLRSQGREKATIFRQTQVGGDTSRAEAQLMYFIPARNFLSIDQATFLDGVN